MSSWGNEILAIYFQLCHLHLYTFHTTPRPQFLSTAEMWLCMKIRTEGEWGWGTQLLQLAVKPSEFSFQQERDGSVPIVARSSLFLLPVMETCPFLEKITSHLLVNYLGICILGTRDTILTIIWRLQSCLFMLHVTGELDLEIFTLGGLSMASIPRNHLIKLESFRSHPSPSRERGGGKKVKIYGISWALAWSLGFMGWRDWQWGSGEG
jgi:hypothetical protein